MLKLYRDEGLELWEADNSRESGIYRIYQMLSFGQLKVFKTLRNWLGEYRIYRRDENGKVVKQNDHLMDATRYYAMTGMQIAEVRPMEKSRHEPWQPADRTVGY